MNKPSVRYLPAVLALVGLLAAAGCDQPAKPPTPPATANTASSASGPKDANAGATRGGMTDVRPGMAGVPK